MNLSMKGVATHSAPSPLTNAQFAFASIKGNICLVQGEFFCVVRGTSSSDCSRISFSVRSLAREDVVRTNGIRCERLPARVHHSIPLLSQCVGAPCGHACPRTDRRALYFVRGGKGDSVPCSRCYGAASDADYGGATSIEPVPIAGVRTGCAATLDERGVADIVQYVFM